MDEHLIENRLWSLTNSFGPFSPRPNVDQARLALNMINEIDEVEKLLHNNTSSTYEYGLGIAIRNYCAWYVRGDERTKYLQRTILHLKKAIDINGLAEAKVELASILIEEKQVRNLEMALKLAHELKEAELLPNWMQSIVEKAKRWSGKADLPSNNDFSDLSAAPAVIQEERTKLRKLIIYAFKAKDIEKATILVSRLYNLGLLAAYLYGGWSGSSGVIGSEFDAATKELQRVKSSLNFGYMGRISDAGFLSVMDYKRIEKIFGPKSETISVSVIEKLLGKHS
jgi:hypothetical protein